MATSSFTGDNAFDEMAPQVSSASTRKAPCDVFINHRGHDVKHTLATAIYNILNGMGLKVCLDYRWLEPGDDIPVELQAVMSSALVHIAIFSKNYAQSPWCLAELSFMIKTRTKIIPVFYGVEPFELRYVAEGTGIYVEAFVEHVKKGRFSFNKLVEWNRALHEISFRAGYLVNNIFDKEDLLKKIGNSVLKALVCGLPLVAYYNTAYHNTDAVGIEHKITEVIKLLEWDNNKPAVAVVIHGIGGAGKTTLANEVYATLNLQGWKHSKVTLIKNLESNPDIEELQSQILQDLTGMKECKIRDFQCGQQQLKSAIEREDVFIYIDNILKIEHLQNLLPKQISSVKKVRILATARKTNASGVFESSGIIPCKKYPIESLPFESALQLLCRKVDRGREINSIVGERPQAIEITENLSCCPLFLEVVGSYLHKRNNEVEAYERVFRWITEGQAFSCDKEDRFDESRILFAYHDLEPSAQEAFLDICSFFYDWEWTEVALIVGKEEMQCLQEGALVKKMEFSEGNSVVEKIGIHDLILTAGRNKSKGNRFKSVDDFALALENEGVLRQTKGVWLLSEDKPFHVSAEVLDTMSESLRVFAMGESTIVSGQCSKRFDKLRFLQADTVPNLAIDILKLKHLNFMDYSFKKNEVWSPPKNFCGLKEKKLLRSDFIMKNNEIWSAPKNFSDLQVLKLQRPVGWLAGRNIHVAIEFGHLNKLKHLALTGFHINEISNFVKVHSLQKLRLNAIKGLKELPGSLGKLRLLQELYLFHCRNLKKLQVGFGQLSALSRLDLRCCNSLQELPCDFENLLALQSLILSGCSSLLELPLGLGNLPSLRYINVMGCRQLSGFPHRVAELSLLRGEISFCGCSDLKELPEDIYKLTMLRSLSLQGCRSLIVLPISFSQLTCLENLDLSDCESLQELCNGFHCLGRLRTLNMLGCKSLKVLPIGFSELTSLQELVLEKCESLQELCNKFHCLVGLRTLNMSGCKSLSRLPQGFGKLGCLERLDLSGCDKLEELSSDFGCLRELKYLVLSRCKILCKLPDCFGMLRCLERLELSGCDRLKELGGDLDCLAALKDLKLSGCKNLSKLPGCFGQLRCLEKLDLSMCCKLEELSNDFHFLPSLIVLDLSNCESLDGKWMDNVGAIQSLWRLNIAASDRMIRRWIEMQKNKEVWHFVVVTDFYREEAAEGMNDLLLQVMISKIFNEERLLIDNRHRSFYSSSVLPDTPLIFIIHRYGQIDGKLLETNMQSLSSKALSIIYVGEYLDSLPSEVTDRILAYTPPDSKISLFFNYFHNAFPSIRFSINAVFRSSEDFGEKGIKCPSKWKDVSYIFNEVAFLIRTPRESNVDILRAVLQTDFLLLNNSRQVKLTELQGKVILLLYTFDVTMSEIRYSALKDIYLKMPGSYHHLVEVVWIPDWYPNDSGWDKFSRAVVNAPWPVVPNPWLNEKKWSNFICLLQAPETSFTYPRVVVVDSRGRISNKDAMGMIERWGVKAYPFSQSRAEELRKSEWEKAFNSNDFVFHNLYFTLKEVKKASPLAKMMLLCVGKLDKMLEFSAELDHAVPKLKRHFQMFYVGSNFFSGIPKKDEMKIKKIGRTIPCISLSEANRFWQRIRYLYSDLNRMKSDKKRVQVRRNMVLSVVSAEAGSRKENEIRVIVVDKSGEMVSGKGKEVTEALLWHCGEVDSKLLSKIEGVREVLQGQWKDGIIHRRHPQHRLLQVHNIYRMDPYYAVRNIHCSLCPKDYLFHFYQCSVCGNYVICEECIES